MSCRMSIGLPDPQLVQGILDFLSVSSTQVLPMFQQTEEKGGTKKKQTQLDWILFVGFQLSSTTQLMCFLIGIFVVTKSEKI